MSERRIDELFRELHAEIVKLPASRSRACALTRLEEALLWMAIAAEGVNSLFDLTDEA